MVVLSYDGHLAEGGADARDFDARQGLAYVLSEEPRSDGLLRTSLEARPAPPRLSADTVRAAPPRAALSGRAPALYWQRTARALPSARSALCGARSQAR